MAPQRFREQFDQIQRSMPDVPLVMGPDDSAEFLYEKGVVLARDGEEARLVEDTVRDHFTATDGLTPDQVRRASPAANRTGITRIRVGDPGEGDGSGDPTVAHALRSLRTMEGRAGRRLVSRNHVVSIAVNACPGDEPVPVPVGAPPNPAPADTPYDAGTAVGVLVIDTGLMHDYRSSPLLAHTEGDPQIKECDEDGVLQQYVGHGTFIAGLVAAVAPNTHVTVRNTLNDAGAILESELGEKLFEAVDRDGWPEILSLSAGTSNGRTDGLLGVHAFMEELRDQRTLLVAAAGNNGSATPSGPPPTRNSPAGSARCCRSARCAPTASSAPASATTAAGSRSTPRASASPAPSPASDHPCPTSTSTPPTTPAGTASATPAPAGTPGTTASSANPARRRPSRTR